MQIEVKKEINTELRKTWIFNLFDLTAVYVGYYLEEKPKGKRTWKIKQRWDKYSRDHSLIEPELPIGIKEQAFIEVKKHIKILTWSEWKHVN